MTIRVPKAGDAPVTGKGAPGDLLVQVKVAPSKTFRRQGPNLYHNVRIPMHTAVLGGRVRVPTLDGDVDVRVPGGTQQGEEMVLKGRGMPMVYRQDKGDLFVTFSVQLPRYVMPEELVQTEHLTRALCRSLNQRQREIMEMFADDVEGRPPKDLKDTGSQENSSAETQINGAENSFNSSTAPSSRSGDGGWLSGIWRNIRKLTS